MKRKRRKQIILQTVDGIAVRLKAPFDLSFLRTYGTVFKVIDGQGSGNLCFGVKADDGKRYFVKFAGAETVNNHGQPVEDAIARLKAAERKYRDLAHPLLVRMLRAEEIGGGFALIFDWSDGVSFGDYHYPDLHKKFMALPVAERARVFNGVLEFHAHVARQEYVAMDFNDDSVLYNFVNGEFLICDIDFYAKQCYMNGMGEAIGAPELMSPEEFRVSGLVDEVSNVYAMGAAAFMLLTDYDRSPRKWPLSEALNSVVRRATSAKRADRQQSIQQLMEEWRTCL